MLFKKIQTEVSIEGMHCMGCAGRVKNILSSLKGVKKVNVSLEEKKAIILSSNELNDDDINSAIDDLGFKVINIKHE